MPSEWATVTRDRDARVRSAVAAGLTKHRVHQITGIGRSTIDRTSHAATTPSVPALCQIEARMITGTRAGTLPMRQGACSASGGSGI
jgi:hypothetical protein